MDAVTVILYLYWASDILLALYGFPTTFDWISPPKFLSELFHYGKCRDGKVESVLVKLIEIPKSWFIHYYIFGLCISTFMVAITFSSFVFGYDLYGRECLTDLIGSRVEVIDKYAVMMICIMMFIQHSRRVYECFFVSVYSKGTMNVLHYLLGLMLYSTVQLCAICDGPKLNVVRTKSDGPYFMEIMQNLDVRVLAAHWNKILGGLLFLWASYYHHDSHVILGNLRKDKTGQKVLHRQHVIPRGGLFYYLSAPHFVCEILIYVAMGLVALNSCTFWMGPVLFTITNQSLMVNETHKWYKKNFKNYPNRYRFIPCVL